MHTSKANPGKSRFWDDIQIEDIESTEQGESPAININYVSSKPNKCRNAHKIS